MEDRTLLSTTSVIASTFNGTAIPAGNSIWFNSNFKVSGLGSSPVTIRFEDATIDSAQFHVDVPDAIITFSPTTTQATTIFDAAANAWITKAPSSGLSGNVFLAGATMSVPPGGLPGGIKPVTWQANFSTDAPGITLQWKWSAAIYTNFSSDYNALGVKPVDGNQGSQYANSHHAGTPENFASFVVGGARGGGGSNFTGSWSSTKAVTPGPFTPPPQASLSGFVYEDLDNDGIKDTGEAGIGGVLLTLRGTDDLGNAVYLTTTTLADGSYQFASLRPGAYSIQESQPAAYLDGLDTIGSQGGSTDADEFFDILLGAGVQGINNNFGERLPGSDF